MLSEITIIGQPLQILYRPTPTLTINNCPEYDYLLLDKNIPANQWATHDMNIKDNNHSFKTTRPLSGREVRISTIHHN